MRRLLCWSRRSSSFAAVGCWLSQLNATLHQQPTTTSIQALPVFLTAPPSFSSPSGHYLVFSRRRERRFSVGSAMCLDKEGGCVQNAVGGLVDIFSPWLIVVWLDSGVSICFAYGVVARWMIDSPWLQGGESFIPPPGLVLLLYCSFCG